MIAKRQREVMTVLKIQHMTKQIKKAITITDTIKITDLLSMKEVVQDQISANASPLINTKYGNVSDDCLGKADCFTGVVTKVVDGDTVDVNDVRVRLALVNTAERGEPKYTDATEFVKSVCGIGAKALVDEDDGQPNRSYNRMVSLVYCGQDKTSLNQQLLQNGYAKILEQYCSVSEFSKQTWAITNGCR